MMVFLSRNRNSTFSMVSQIKLQLSTCAVQSSAGNSSHVRHNSSQESRETFEKREIIKKKFRNCREARNYLEIIGQEIIEKWEIIKKFPGNFRKFLRNSPEWATVLLCTLLWWPVPGYFSKISRKFLKTFPFLESFSKFSQKFLKTFSKVAKFLETFSFLKTCSHFSKLSWNFLKTFSFLETFSKLSRNFIKSFLYFSKLSPGFSRYIAGLARDLPAEMAFPDCAALHTWDEDTLIKSYFKDEYTYEQICSFLESRHGIHLTMDQLRTRLKKLNLRRQKLKHHCVLYQQFWWDLTTFLWSVINVAKPSCFLVLPGVPFLNTGSQLILRLDSIVHSWLLVHVIGKLMILSSIFVVCTQKEHLESGCDVGYRVLHQWLTQKYNLVVGRYSSNFSQC